MWAFELEFFDFLQFLVEFAECLNLQEDVIHCSLCLYSQLQRQVERAKDVALIVTYLNEPGDKMRRGSHFYGT